MSHLPMLRHSGTSFKSIHRTQHTFNVFATILLLSSGAEVDVKVTHIKLEKY